MALDSGLRSEFRKKHWLMIASTRTFPGLQGCASWCSEFCPGQNLRLIFAFSTQESSSNQPSRKTPCGFSISSPPTPPMMISLLPDVIICRKSKHHVCEHKSCHLFMLQTSGRKKENHSSLFIKKKKKNWHNAQALVAWNQPVINSQEMPDPRGLHCYYKLWIL